MNTNFSFERFKQVFFKDLREGYKTFWITMLIIVAIPTVWWLFDASYDVKLFSSPIWRLANICFFVLLTAMMAPSRIYKYCNIPNKGVYFAMLPASKGEKFLSMTIITTVVMPLTVLVASILLDCLLWILPIGRYDDFLFSDAWLLDCFDTNEGLMMLFVFLSCYLFVASAFTFTNTLFKKHKVSKTILWSMLINSCQTLLLPIVFVMIGTDNLDGIDVLLSSKLAMAYNIAFNLIITALFYWLAYYRLKRMKY